MKVRLQTIVDELYQDVDNAVVDKFYDWAKYKEPTEDKGVSNITDIDGFIDTENAEFQLFLRDFMEIYEDDYQADLINNVLAKYYDHAYDLEDEISNEEDYQSDIELDMKKTQKFLDSQEDLEERFLGPSDEVIDDSKEKGLYAEGYKDNVKDYIATGLNDDRANDVLNAVIGQLSDGIWENSRGMEKYWEYADIERKGSEIYIVVDRDSWASGYRGKSDEDIKRYFAQKVKQIVKEEGLEWSRDNTDVSNYLDYHSGVTVQDAYRVYDKLLGRKDRIELQEGYKETLEKELERIQEIIANADPGKDISGIEEKRDYLMDKLNQLED